MKNQITLTNEQINAKSFPKTSIASIIRDLEWEINYCNDIVTKAKANQEKNLDTDYSWTLNAWSTQKASAEKALKSIKLCYRHLSKDEKEIPLVSLSLTPNMFTRMNTFIKKAFIENYR